MEKELKIGSFNKDNCEQLKAEFSKVFNKVY